jgi:hypothetical protein
MICILLKEGSGIKPGTVHTACQKMPPAAYEQLLANRKEEAA